MPYVKQSKRKTALKNPADVGELNLKVAKECLKYLNQTGERYKYYNDIHAVLINPFKLSDGKDIEKPKTLRELKSKIGLIVQHYISAHRADPDYEDDIHGVFSCLDKEFYFRMTHEYEKEACYKNGDVFPRPLKECNCDKACAKIEAFTNIIDSEIEALKQEIVTLKTKKGRKIWKTDK